MLALGTVAAGQPRDSLDALARDFVCPERLSGDVARNRAVTRFVQRYGAIRPRSTIPERLAFRDRLMKRRGCAPEQLIHTFPQE